MRPSHPLPLAAAALATAAIVPAAVPADDSAPAQPRAGAAATVGVRVVDDFYSPSRLTVVRGTTVRWRWSRRNSGRHDVFLNSRPRGAAHFHSPSARRSFTYRRKLNRAGTYRILCTFHDGMRMRISVTR